MNTKRLIAASLAAGLVAVPAVAGLLDKAWLRGTTDKDPLTYRPGEEMVFTIAPQGLDGAVPPGEYFLSWKRSDDYGEVKEGKVPFTGEPFVYRTSLGKPGFVRLEAYVVDKAGRRYTKKFMGDATTPEGRRAMNAFERGKKAVFFDGGAGVDIDKLATHEEPKDFDAFWAKQYKRLDRVPIKADRIEIPCSNPRARIYAVRIDCAGLRPVTGYLSIPKAVDEGKTFPCRLETHGYSGDSCQHGRPGGARDTEIVLNMNAHGLKLVEFGATEADTKALRWETRSNGCSYAFDAKQNEDPEVAYFNGMVLRVKRGLQYLKTIKGWNGKDLYASGGSQGGLQTIWAAGLDPQVTKAESSITWCCDMGGTELGRNRGTWYIKWVPALGYYDPINVARRISKNCRTLIPRAGLGDYTCPPSGLAILFNNIPGPKKINWEQGSTHPYIPPEPHQKFSVTGNGWTED